MTQTYLGILAPCDGMAYFDKGRSMPGTIVTTSQGITVVKQTLLTS